MPTTAPNRKTIEVVWLCDMGEACVNTLRPGTHGGFDGYVEAGECRGIPRPHREEPLAPNLAIGRSVPGEGE